MKTALIVTGILAALVVIFPGLVVIGMFLLVIPGLVLMAMPTVFLYLLAVWLIVMVLPIENVWLARSAAFGIALVLGSLAVLPFRFSAIEKFESAQLAEISADAPVTLSGHVRYEDFSVLEYSEPPPCDALCLAILDLDAVTGVTRSRGGQSATYRLVPAEQLAGPPDRDGNPPRSIDPFSPEEILSLTEQSGSREAIVTYWNERLNGADRLVRTTEKPLPNFTLSENLTPNTDGFFATSVTISQADTVLFQTAYVGAPIPTPPLYFGFTADSAGAGFSNSRFTLGSITRTHGDVKLKGGQKRILAQAIATKDYSALTADAD